ncbi:MAG: DUF4336 domain-containing protein [Rudaea sp.]
MPFPTRMSVARLSDDRVWVHSPVALDDALREEIDALGHVAALIAPNSLHHLFVGAWQAAYPQARTWAAPGLRRKCPQLRFDADLDDGLAAEWGDEIDSLVFRQSRIVNEVVFHHRPSRTLILTDLIENFDARTLTWPMRLIARLGGVLAPNGSTPRDFRASFRGSGRAQARACRDRVLGWNVQRIVLSHGLCVDTDAGAFLQRALAWLGP